MSTRPDDSSGRRGSVLAVLLETAVLGAFCVAAIVWIIPAYTSGNALGLDPSYMPTLYAASALILIVLNGLLHASGLAPARPMPVGSLRATLPIMLVAVAGGLAFRYVGPVAVAAAVLPAMMLLLGERRWLLIAGATVVWTVILLLIFR